MLPRPPLVFLRITPLNWLLAFALSFRHDVRYWRARLPAWLLARFARLPVESLVSRDEWLRICNDGFAVWRERLYPALERRYRLCLRYRGIEVDFSLLLLQHLSQEFERLYQLARVLERSGIAQAHIVEPWFARVCTPDLEQATFGGCRLVRSVANRLAESAHEWLVAGAHLARLAFTAVRRLFLARATCATAPVFWSGISPQEVPEQVGRLDFAWPVRYLGADPRRVVFLLPRRLSAAQRRYFASTRGIALAPTELGRLVGAGAVWRAAAAAFACACRALLANDSAHASYRALFAARSFLWMEIVRARKPCRYITTTSYCWPERPEVFALAALGVPSVIWAYSANSLTFTHALPGHRDLGMQRWAFGAREFWVWNRAYRDWLARQQVAPGVYPTRLRVAGALMAGDRGWCERPRKDAKAFLGLDPVRFHLAVFDVPRMNVEHRRTFYGGPYMFAEGYHEAFFETLLWLLEKLPSLHILLKLKRHPSSPWHTIAASQLALVNGQHHYRREGRVSVLDPNVDPYLPIAACDAALGMPYTSPVLAVLALGKPAAYFDPLGCARYPSECAYAAITVSDREALRRRIAGWLRGCDEANRERLDRLVPVPEPDFSILNELPVPDAKGAGRRLAPPSAGPQPRATRML